MADIAAYLKTVKLPVMPEVAQALIRTLDDEDATVPQITALIAKDPVLTASLLRMANSASFGLSRTVSSLDSAVNVLGLSQIRVRALSICMAQTFNMPSKLDRMEFWRYSMVCAGYSRWLAGFVGLDMQQAWLTGMMLRLGELVMLVRNPELLPQVEKKPVEPGQRWVREFVALGFDEGQLTAELARQWDFPDTVVQALACAVRPTGSGKYSSLGAVVHLAALLADQPANASNPLDTLPTYVLQVLGLDTERLKTRMPDAESFADTSMLAA